MEPKNVTIKGTDYTIYPFLGMKGYKMQIKLGKMVAPALADLLGAMPQQQDNFSVMDMKVEHLGDALHKLLEALYSGDPNGDFILDLLSKTQREGQFINQQVFNEAFTANYEELAFALYEVIKVNNFFSIGRFGNPTNRPKTIQKSKGK